MCADTFRKRYALLLPFCDACDCFGQLQQVNACITRYFILPDLQSGSPREPQPSARPCGRVSDHRGRGGESHAHDVCRVRFPNASNQVS